MTKRQRQLTQGYFQRFAQTKILVVGDLMVDEFVWGKVSRISPEAPVPVVWVQSESVMPGGAANVASNIRALGGQVAVAGLVGEDLWGDVLLGELTARGIETSTVIRTDRPTTVKTRVIAHHQQVVRVDREEREACSGESLQRLLDVVLSSLKSVDAVILEDYGKGLISRALLEAVIPAARKHRTLITVDPKEDHFDLYHRVSALTPNRIEAGRAVGYELETEEDITRAGEALLKRVRCDALLMTLGEDGMCLFEHNAKPTRIPTVAQEVFDVAGAGDTVIGAFTLAIASGAPMVQAAQIANHAAGIVVGKLGVASANAEELRAKLLARGRRVPAKVSSARKVLPSVRRRR